MLVTDSTRLRGRDLASVVSDAIDGGVNVVQLRDRALPHDGMAALALDLRYAIASRALLFINGDVQAAIHAGAHGLHLPADGPSIAEARARVGPDMLISRAVHSLDDAIAAERDGADMLILGSIFASASHPGVPPLGLEALRDMAARVRTPLIAIGGITPDNASDVMRAGAAGVAAISAILDADDACAAACNLSVAIGARVRS
jgi:thiamine-phosphate pyrophosphorylase